MRQMGKPLNMYSPCFKGLVVWSQSYPKIGQYEL
ncbi:hypothetical protein E2C01_095366 [Portunus trituberculatus]|uniref:Uncharacterized protein n=1 Tax=Portunus trituberculatus TaxID=210409 RepID=A0A5B7JYI8_PORTR|nr:hypothetical protein [Portunus trituberculatus]